VVVRHWPRLSGTHSFPRGSWDTSSVEIEMSALVDQCDKITWPIDLWVLGVLNGASGWWLRRGWPFVSSLASPLHSLSSGEVSASSSVGLSSRSWFANTSRTPPGRLVPNHGGYIMSSKELPTFQIHAIIRKFAWFGLDYFLGEPATLLLRRNATPARNLLFVEEPKHRFWRRRVGRTAPPRY